MMADKTVSIHAPTRGATTAEFQEWPTNRCFNSRAHAGRDPRRHRRPRRERLFQFTRPRGARLRVFRVADRVLRFNSRAHAGRDE